MVSVDPRSATYFFFTMMLAPSMEENLGGGTVAGMTVDDGCL